MKTYNIILLCIGLSLLVSCQKFVDIKRSSSQITLTKASDCQLMLDNYTTMNTNYPVDGEISADDYYIDNNSYQNDINILQEERQLYTWSPAAIRTTAVASWQNTYQVVYISNLVLETLQKLQGGATDQTTLNTLKGSALFYRAYCFWQIAQMYTKQYSAVTAPQDPGIPLRLSSNINEKSSRGTLQDTYDKITQDLLEAINLLPITSSIATRPNKVAAYAMLARTYLSMEDYPNALINANEALKLKNQLLDYNTISKVSPTPFTRYNLEVIFHSITFRTPILSPGTSLPNGGVARIDPQLAASYTTNDLRRQIFLKANMKPNPIPPPAPANVVDGSFRFSGNYEQASLATFFNGLAVDELYLIRAECYARTGKKDEAMKDLNDLLKTRWITGTYIDMSAGTSDEALTKVLEERRKELLMRGLRWTDLRRLKKDIARKENGTGTVIATLSANDPRYTLLIPQDVITYGNISQNPR